MRALAAQVFIRQAAAPQVALGQAGQAMRLVHFQHIALQHGVVDIAAHSNAAVGKHMAVVFDVLAQLGTAFVFQPGFEPCQHLVKWQLLGRVRPSVAQRHIGGFTGRDAERQANQFGPHRVDRSGFGVQRHQLGALQALQPAVECFPGKHRVALQVGVAGAVSSSVCAVGICVKQVVGVALGRFFARLCAFAVCVSSAIAIGCACACGSTVVQ